MSTASPAQERLAREMRDLDDEHLAFYYHASRERDEWRRACQALASEIKTSEDVDGWLVNVEDVAAAMPDDIKALGCAQSPMEHIGQLVGSRDETRAALAAAIKERDFKASESEAAISVLQHLRTRAETAEAQLHALRLVCGTSDANRFETALDRANERAAKAETELAALKAALQPLRARIEDELRTGRPAILAVQWFRIEPIAKALGLIVADNRNPLP